VLVQLSGVSKSFGSQDVLQDVTFQVNPSEKIGLIGANGAGKTTLLKMIGRLIEPDAGSITRKSQLQIGALDQIPDFHEGTSVLEEGLRASAHLQGIENELRDLEHLIAESFPSSQRRGGAERRGGQPGEISEGHGEILDRYSQLQHEFELKGGYSYRARTEAALHGVGFAVNAFDRPSRDLSGGEKNRLALAKLLLSDAELLLLDEPTNHLDIRSIEWLESFLKETAKTAVIVSHDRFFLDRAANRIIEIAGATAYDYRGNYSDYLKQRAERLARQEKEWQLQKEWIEQQEDYIRRNIAGQKTKQAQSRRKLLARVKPLEKPQSASAKVKFRFLPVERSGRYILTTRQLTIGYETTPLVDSIEFEVQRNERWAILGPNGSGKTTLLRTLIGARSPIEGELEWNGSLDVGYYDQQLRDLNPDRTVLEEIRELDSTATDGELRSYLAQFLFSGDDVSKVVGKLSGGEKSRLMLARIIYASPQLLALDEPTNHLDIASREALETALTEYPGTILFVTHDRYLVQKIATHLIYIEDGKAHVFDRLSAFEEWLKESESGDSHPPPIKEMPADSPARERRETEKLSKNKREQLEKEVAEVEKKIASVEAEIAELELSFQNPATGTDWESTHRRYADLKVLLETLYEDLARHWEMMGQ
jgi:ATP-binding cassette subfamily F protein 3